MTKARVQQHTELVLRDLRFAHAWNVRGDPRDEVFLHQVERSLGLALPVRANASVIGASACALWLGPRSWLWMTDDAAPAFHEARQAINAGGGALFDISASQLAWVISGAAAERVLNRLCPLDLHPSAFPAGHCAQTLLGHVAGVLFRPGDPSRFILMVARSLARDVWHHLCLSAEGEGFQVEDPVALEAAVRA